MERFRVGDLSSGFVELVHSKGLDADRNGVLDRRDLGAIATARASLRHLFDLVGARKVRPLEMPKGTFDSCYHPAGGLRMGTDPKTSVTDPGGRVHGLKNLFVSGTALFPTIGTANPTLTMVAVAVRVARSIRERGGRGEL